MHQYSNSLTGFTTKVRKLTNKGASHYTEAKKLFGIFLCVVFYVKVIFECCYEFLTNNDEYH